MDSFWNNRTTLVTGATGFVGTNFVRHLIAKGAKLFALVRDKNRINSLKSFDLDNKIKILQGSIDDLNAVEKILKDNEIEAVFHCAAQSLRGLGNDSPLPTFEANIRGTYHLLEACRRSKSVKRIVMMSSYNAYGSNSTPPYREDFSLEGVIPYDASKACADLIARSFAQTYQLPVTIVRPANVYGAGDLNLTRIIPGTIISVLRNENPIIRSDGTPQREFIHIDDTACACLMLAENIEQSAGEAFNIGTGKPVQILELTDKIIAVLNKQNQLSPEILSPRADNQPIDAQYLSTDKINNLFGWKAGITLDEGLRQTAEWYRNHFWKIG